DAPRDPPGLLSELRHASSCARDWHAAVGVGRARDAARARSGGAANALNPGRTRKASRPVGPRHPGQRIPGAQLAGGTARAAGAWRPARARRLVAFAPGRT